MQYDDLLGDVRAALDAGRVEEADLRRLLARADRAGRPGVAGVLRAAGAIVFLLGLGAPLRRRLRRLSVRRQLVGPFVFPAAALAAAIGLHRRGAPAVGGRARRHGRLRRARPRIPGSRPVAADAGTGYALVASAAAIAIVVAMHAAVRVVRLTSWGLSASLVAFTAFASDAAGFLDGGTAPWLLAAQFAVALAVGLVLARPEPRGRRERAPVGRPSRTPRLHLRDRRRGRRLVRALARRPHHRRRRDARRRRRA